MKRILTNIIIMFFAISFVFVCDLGAVSVYWEQLPGTVGDEIFRQQIEDEVGDKWDDQGKLAKGLGNAAAYASHAATFQGYQGYDIFCVSVGFMLGFQAPSANPSEYSDIGDSIERDGDIYAGVGAGFAINLGINLGFLIDNLYANIKFGKLPKIKASNGSKVEMTTFGIGANYQIFQPRSLGLSILKWRGLSVGTGILYSGIETRLVLDNALKQVSYDYGGNTLTMEPGLTLGTNTKIVTIPFDVTTSIRLLWVLNLNLGFGLDFMMGKTDINIVNRNNVDDSSTGVGTDGILVVDASTLNKNPNVASFRIMTGLGLVLGPVFIDLPVTYHVASGASIGLSLGVVW